MTRQHILSPFVVLLLAAPVAFAADPAPKPAEKPAAQSEVEIKRIALAEFEKMRADKDDKSIVILDVRTPEEWKDGRIPGAVHINWRDRDFNEQVAKLDKSKKYLVYCLKGVRSQAAAERMATLGFTKLYNFTGGWGEYSKAGKPVEK
jgi:phage shock protein E